MFKQKELLELAVMAAFEAAREVMDVYARDFSVESKEDSSPLTEADTRSHDAIIARLEAGAGSPAAPEADPILSEEGAHLPHAEREAWKRFWLVDPLDGTKEFIKKNGEFTVNIALMEQGAAAGQAAGADTPAQGASPTLGVVFAPDMEELYVGEVGTAAFRLKIAPGHAIPDLDQIVEEGERLPVGAEMGGPGADGGPGGDAGAPGGGSSGAGGGAGVGPAAARSAEAGAAARPYTIVASRSHLSPETEAFIEERRKEHPDLDMISAGSSLKICRVAEGAADEYPRFAPTMEWDTAAGDAVARAAGCAVLAWDPQDREAGPLRYNKEDLHNPWFLVRR